jgi:hypothetical protein
MDDAGVAEYEQRVEVRRVTERFPTGEVKKTERVGLEWVGEHAAPPEGYCYCSISSSDPAALEMNFRRAK